MWVIFWIPVFCYVIVHLVVLGASFSSEMSGFFFFFFLGGGGWWGGGGSSSCQLFVLVGFFFFFSPLQWHTVGAEIKVPYVENPELLDFLPLKGQSIAMHVSPIVRKVSIVLSDNICLPSPFTMFSKIVSHYFLKKFRKISGQWQTMKSSYRHDQNPIGDRLHVHQPFIHSLFGCCKWFKKNKKKLFWLTVSFHSLRNLP